MQLVIVSGLSGAGKTVALKQLEDLGYYCIDNIPLLLLEPLAERAVKFAESRYQRMAVGIDAREGAERVSRATRGPSRRGRARAHRAPVIFC